MVAVAALAAGLQNPEELLYVGIAVAIAAIAALLVRRRLHQRWLAQHTDRATILLMNPQRFEVFCRELMTRAGCQARGTRMTNDQGVDSSAESVVALRAGRGRPAACAGGVVAGSRTCSDRQGAHLAKHSIRWSASEFRRDMHRVGAQVPARGCPGGREAACGPTLR